MRIRSSIISILALAMLVPSLASATSVQYIYSESINSVGGPYSGGKAGAVQNIDSTYNTSGAFSWEYSIGKSSSNVFSDGFYLVVNAGGNPKSATNELAIIYGNLDTGDISIYNYDKARGGHSFKNQSAFLGKVSNAINVSQGTSEQTVSFSLDVSSLNGLDLGSDWRGVQFDDSLGYWFHPFVSSVYNVQTTGLISSIGFNAIGWVDTAFRTATATTATGNTEVPEPSSVALLLAGIAGIVLKRKRVRT